MLATASRYYAQQQRLSALAVRQLRGTSSIADVLRLLAVYQATAALLAMEHGTEALREQDIPDGGATVNPFAFTVTPSAPSVLDDVDSGHRFDRIVGSLVNDAGRSAMGAFTASRNREIGHIRTLTPPSCSRCVILAGRFYRWSEAFQRHPKCFPAGVVTSGPALEAASRRWYQGELVVLTTASGQNLSLTSNHPVLTSRGWVPAYLLQEGDEVVRSTQPEGASPLVVPDHHEVPSLIEDVWRSFSVDGLDRVPTAAKDFHGDGQSGEVDVVYADRALWCGGDPARFEPVGESRLATRVMLAAPLDLQRMAQLVNLRDATQAGGAVRGGDLPLPFGGGQLRVPHRAGLAHVTPLDPSVSEYPSNGAARDAVLTGQGVLASPTFVGADNRLTRNIHPRAKWDAPSLSDAAEQSSRYTTVGLDLLNRLSGQVELDRLILCRSVEFRGHVFSLTSSEGWHTANSLIVSNCDCTMVPGDRSAGLSDPFGAFERGEITDLSKAQTKAVDDGADISQVVNASKGMQTVSFAGRRVQVTTEGTTSRGLAFRALSQRGTTQQRFVTGVRPVTRTVARAPRLSPEAIYKVATDRQDAIRLLRSHGYIF